jgi:hypothetical protein
MPRYLIEEHLAVPRVLYYVVEADSEEDARDGFDSGGSEYVNGEDDGGYFDPTAIVVRPITEEEIKRLAALPDLTLAEPQPVTFPPAVDPLARMEE